MENILFPDPANPKDQITFLTKLCFKARSEGLLSLQDDLDSNNFGFLSEVTIRALQLVIDGTASEYINYVISNYEISTLENFDYHWQIFRPYFIKKRTGDINDTKEFTKLFLLDGHPENEFISQQIQLIDSEHFIKNKFINSLEKLSPLPDSLYFNALSDMYQSYIALYKRCFRIIHSGVISIHSGDNHRIMIDQIKSTGAVNGYI